MLQQPWEGVYNCSAQQSTEGEFTKCTVVIRKRQISDDIIEKQSFLIQTMKQDNLFIKKLLVTKSAEVAKMKVTIELLQSQKTELYQQLEKVRKNQQDLSNLQAENQRLKNENQELRIEIQSQRVYIEQPFKAKIQELTQHIQSLKGQNQFLVQMNKHEDNRPQQNFNQLQRRCRQLKEELDRQRLMNEKLRRNLQKKLTSSQPIKIIQGTYEADAHQNFDQVKGTIQMGFHRKIGSDQLENSLGRSRKQSDILFHDSENSYEESDRPVNRSVAYQKSEAEIQTQRWQNYESGLISRQKIEKSFNQKRNNHHMKPLDQHTRIMNLSKELNEKDKTIKELQKKVQKQKKNSESVKKKLKEKEKQLKHLKKERSLTREHGVEQDADKSRKQEEITEKARNSQQTKEKVRTKHGYQEKIINQERKVKQNYEVEQQNKVTVIEQFQEEIIIQKENAEESQKTETNIKTFEVQNRKAQYQEQVNQNIVQIKEETSHKQVIVQTYSEKDQLQKDRIQINNKILQNQIQTLRQKIYQLQSQNMKDRLKYQQVILDYKEDQLNIRISEKHDEDSFTEPNNQLARLRQENQTLRQQLKQYTDNEPIPFHEVEEETHFREVVTQTAVQKETESEAQANLNWGQVIEKLQSDDRKRKSQQQSNKAPANEPTGNNFFSDLMSGLLGGNTETVRETEESKKEETEKQLSAEGQVHKEVQFNVRVSQKHDQDSFTEPADELTKLRLQVEALRQKLRQYTDNEPIPFQEVQEQTHLRQVVTQTTVQKFSEAQRQSNKNWEATIERIKSQQQNKKIETVAIETESTTSNNNFFSNLMTGLLGNSAQQKKQQTNAQAVEQESQKVEQDLKADEKEFQVLKVEINSLKEQKILLKSQNEVLRESVNKLTDSVNQLREELQNANKKKSTDLVEVQRETYTEQQLNIDVAVKDGQNIQKVNKAETAELDIPFFDYTDENRLNNLATNNEQAGEQATGQVNQFTAETQVVPLNSQDHLTVYENTVKSLQKQLRALQEKNKALKQIAQANKINLLEKETTKVQAQQIQQNIEDSSNLPKKEDKQVEIENQVELKEVIIQTQDQNNARQQARVQNNEQEIVSVEPGTDQIVVQTIQFKETVTQTDNLLISSPETQIEQNNQNIIIRQIQQNIDSMSQKVINKLEEEYVSVEEANQYLIVRQVNENVGKISQKVIETLNEEVIQAEQKAIVEQVALEVERIQNNLAQNIQMVPENAENLQANAQKESIINQINQQIGQKSDDWAKKGHVLQNEICGENFQVFLREKGENSSSIDNNQYIITNNERTLLYTLQEQVSEWKTKYEQILKEKEALQQALNREKSMYIQYELHPKTVKFEPEIQITLDAGGSQHQIQTQSNKRRSQITINDNEQIQRLKQKNNALAEELAQLKSQMNNVMTIPTEQVQIVVSQYKIKENQENKESNQLLEKNEQVQAENLGAINREPLSWDQQQFKKENVLMRKQKNLVDLTLSMKEASGNTQYLTELITNIIEEEKKQPIAGSHYVKEYEQKSANQKKEQFQGQQSRQKALNVQQKQHQNVLKIKIHQKHNESSEMQINQQSVAAEKQYPIRAPVTSDAKVQQVVELREVIVQADTNENNKMQTKIVWLQSQLSAVGLLNSRMEEQILEHKSQIEILKIKLNQVCNTQTQKVLQIYKQQQLNIRISEKHDQDSFTEPNNQLARLRQENETLRQQLKQYTDNEPIPFHEVEEETHFREVVTQTLVQKETESETQANLDWGQVIEKLQSDDRKRKSQQQSNKAPANEATGNNFFSDLMSGLLGGNTEAVREAEESKKEETEKQLLAEGQVHKEVQFNVRVSQKHDQDSFTEPADELTKLRLQVEALRQKLRQYTDNQPIPFQEVQEQTHLRQVVTQTSPYKETQSQARQTLNWEQVITKIQNDDSKRKAEEQANKIPANESKGNNFFTDLMTGLLGGNNQTGRELDENKREEEVQQQLLSDGDKYNEIQPNVKITQGQQVHDLPKSNEQKAVSYPTFAVSQPKQKRNQLRKQSYEVQSIQTPKFEQPLRNINLFASIQKQNFLKIEQTGDQIKQKLAQELALKQEELATLTSKMQWLEQKLLKYKKIIWKSKKHLIDTANLRDPDEMVQIDIEEEEVMLSEVQTQTNPYMFSEEGIKKYTEELEFKLQQEEKISNGLRAKLKRWQNVIKKMHYEGDQINEDIQDLEIEEENIQLCEVQIQVSLNNQDKTEKNQEEVGRVKMKQLVLSGIQNLKKCVGDDSQEGQSENYSDRGRNTKRSVGSDEEQRGKISHQKMLEAEINHIYKDSQSIFKKYQFKIQEDINIDNFKDTLDNFVSFIKRETFHKDIKYNSFEDIKEQENDDSLIEKEKKSSQKGGSVNLLQQHYDQNTHKTSEKVVKQKQSILPMQILYIEKQSILAHPGPTVELNPLFISEVSYKPINKSSYNDLVLKMTELKGGEISKVIECFVEELQMLRNKLTDLGELQLSSCEEVIKVCGFDNLAKFIGH